MSLLLARMSLVETIVNTLQIIIPIWRRRRR